MGVLKEGWATLAVWNVRRSKPAPPMTVSMPKFDSRTSAAMTSLPSSPFRVSLARAAEQLVVAGAAEQHIVAAAAEQPVIVVAGGKCVRSA